MRSQCTNAPAQGDSAAYPGEHSVSAPLSLGFQHCLRQSASPVSSSLGTEVAFSLWTVNRQCSSARCNWSILDEFLVFVPLVRRLLMDIAKSAFWWGCLKFTSFSAVGVKRLLDTLWARNKETGFRNWNSLHDDSILALLSILLSWL